MEFNELMEKFLSFQKQLQEIPGGPYSPEKKMIRSKVDEIFPFLVEASAKENIYFEGSPLQVYKSELDNKMKFAEENSLDFSEYDYYKEEYLYQYKLYGTRPEYLYDIGFSSTKLYNSILNKRLDFLEKLMYEIGIEIKKSQINEMSAPSIYFIKNVEKQLKWEKEKKENIPNLTSYKIKWNGKNAELAELIKALIVSNKLEPGLSQTEIFKRFSIFFDFELKETIGIRDFSKRKDKGGNLTKFIDSLKDSLNNWFETKEEKKDYR